MFDAIDFSSAAEIGEALAKSAASSSFASGVTGDCERRERAPLVEAQLAELGQLEEREENRENLPRLGVLWSDVGPLRFRAHREKRAHETDGAVHVERAWNHFVNVRL